MTSALAGAGARLCWGGGAGACGGPAWNDRKGEASYRVLRRRPIRWGVWWTVGRLLEALLLLLLLLLLLMMILLLIRTCASTSAPTPVLRVARCLLRRILRMMMMVPART
jgi:hypothetical protein